MNDLFDVLMRRNPFLEYLQRPVEPGLQPCPFCGHGKIVTVLTYGRRAATTKCVQCGASTSFKPSIPSAKEAWNQRAGENGHINHDCIASLEHLKIVGRVETERDAALVRAKELEHELAIWKQTAESINNEYIGYQREHRQQLERAGVKFGESDRIARSLSALPSIRQIETGRG